VAIIGLPPCTSGQAPADAQAACNEANAIRAAVCATIPPRQRVTEVQLFTRTDDAQQSWTESKVQSGQDAGAANS